MQDAEARRRWRRWAGRGRASSRGRSTPQRSARISVWPGWRMPAGVERFLVQRQGRDRVDPALPGPGRWPSIRKSYAARPARGSIRPGPDVGQVLLGRLEAGDRPGRSARPPRAGRSPGPSAVPPTQARARSSTDRLPTTNGRARVRSGDSPQARAITSGPTPATSPIVKATSGLLIARIHGVRVSVPSVDPARSVNAWRWPGAAWSRRAAGVAGRRRRRRVGVTGTDARSRRASPQPARPRSTAQDREPSDHGPDPSRRDAGVAGIAADRDDGSPCRLSPRAASVETEAPTPVEPRTRRRPNFSAGGRLG